MVFNAEKLLTLCPPRAKLLASFLGGTVAETVVLPRECVVFDPLSPPRRTCFALAGTKYLRRVS
jgi:hypothetical protein